MDLLVKLYGLPDPPPRPEGMVFRRARGYERGVVTGWVRGRFAAGWADEVEVSFSESPARCWIAARGDELLGFACYDTTARGFFGPTGVAESERGRGIGAVLFRACLDSLAEAGYAYAIIGWTGQRAKAFYERHAGAIEIPGSSPGFYGTPLVARTSG